MNETRGQFTRSNLNADPTDAVGPAVGIAGAASFGRLSGSPTARLNHLYEVADNLFHQAGAHTLRAGVDVLSNDLGITLPQSIRGSYSFSSLANFLNGVYNSSGSRSRSEIRSFDRAMRIMESMRRTSGR